MKVSIVILNWNTLDLLKRCVDSIEAHTDPIFYELIIVDNGSEEEGTKAFIDKVADIPIFNETNKGFSGGNNQGAKEAKGDYICFLNSDTYVGPRWLEDMLEVIYKYPKRGAVGPCGNPIRAEVDGVMYNFPQHKGMVAKDCYVPTLIGFCILVKKHVFEEIGGWCEDFKVGNYEDRYLSEMIKSKGYELWLSAKADLTHEHPGRTFEKNQIDYNKHLIDNKRLFEEKMEEINNGKEKEN